MVQGVGKAHCDCGARHWLKAVAPPSQAGRMARSGRPDGTSALAGIHASALLEAALEMKSTAILQRLAFLSELVGRLPPTEMQTRLREAIPKGYRSYFGPAGRRKGDIGYLPEWRLFVNAKRCDLLAEVLSSGDAGSGASIACLGKSQEET
jgi:hypothetical protein